MMTSENIYLSFISKDVQNAHSHIFIGYICAESDSISSRIIERGLF